MANPQCENGYLRFASELWDAICRIRIPGEARQVFDVIARQTYGYNKKDNVITLTEFVLATKMKKSNVSRAIRQLLAMNLIIKDNDIARYSINKDYNTWKTFLKKTTNVIKSDNESLSKAITNVIKSDNESLSKAITNVIKSDNESLSKAITNVIKSDNESLSKAITHINKDNKRQLKDTQALTSVIKSDNESLAKGVYKIVHLKSTFEDFWRIYPKKRSKGQAEKAWIKLNPDEQLHDRIKYALEQAKKSEDWRRNNGQFIPYPATWINAKGWEDVYEDVYEVQDGHFKVVL